MASAPELIRSKRRLEELRSGEQDRRSQARAEGVLARIENATYEIMRKHEKKSA